MSVAVELESTKKQALPRRDWVLLPLTALLTVTLVASLTELTARRLFSRGGSIYSCFVQDDPATGFRASPNSVCHLKTPEVPGYIDYHFNSCGQRSSTECGPKPPDSFRIALLGSSFVLGYTAKEDQDIAARLPVYLEQRTRRKIDIYNEGMAQESPITVNLRLDRTLRAKPDLILWIVTPWDIRNSSVVLPFVIREGEQKGKFMGGTNAQRMLAALSKGSIFEALNLTSAKIKGLFDSTSTSLMLQHCLYKSQSAYLQASLAGDDDTVGFLKPSYSVNWVNYLQQFQAQYAITEARARAAGVPLVTVLMPTRETAAMVSMGAWPTGFDPYRFDSELRRIVATNGGDYMDILPAFRRIPNPEKFYLPVDGHPTRDGQELLSQLLARELSSGSVSQLKPKSLSESQK